MCDVTQQELGLPANSLDVVVMIFVLSAVQPDQMQAVVDKLVRCLKPGGTLLFRDYGRYRLPSTPFFLVFGTTSRAPSTPLHPDTRRGVCMLYLVLCG